MADGGVGRGETSTVVASDVVPETAGGTDVRAHQDFQTGEVDGLHRGSEINDPGRSRHESSGYYSHRDLSILPSSHGNNSAIGQSHQNGTVVSHSQESGIVVSHSQESGTVVSHSQENGTVVSHSQESGIVVSHSQENGTVVSQSQENGTVVSQSQENGTVVSHSQENGTVASHSQENGTVASHSRQNDIAISQSHGNDSTMIQSQGNQSVQSHSQRPDSSQTPNNQGVQAYNTNTKTNVNSEQSEMASGDSPAATDDDQKADQAGYPTREDTGNENEQRRSFRMDAESRKEQQSPGSMYKVPTGQVNFQQGTRVAESNTAINLDSFREDFFELLIDCLNMLFMETRSHVNDEQLIHEGVQTEIVDMEQTVDTNQPRSGEINSDFSNDSSILSPKDVFHAENKSSDTNSKNISEKKRLQPEDEPNVTYAEPGLATSASTRTAQQDLANADSDDRTMVKSSYQVHVVPSNTSSETGLALQASNEASQFQHVTPPDRSIENINEQNSNSTTSESDLSSDGSSGNSLGVQSAADNHRATNPLPDMGFRVRPEYVNQNGHQGLEDAQGAVGGFDPDNPPHQIDTDVDIHSEGNGQIPHDYLFFIDIKGSRLAVKYTRKCATCFQRPRQVRNHPCGCICNCQDCSMVMFICSLCQQNIDWLELL